jgi:tryptophan-rich sensory protein
MKQPVLGIVWTVIAAVVGAVVMAVTARSLALDPMYVLTRITAPFIFGTIVVLNMLEGSLFRKLRQPLKGVANACTAAILGVALAQMFGRVDRMIVGIELPSGAPAYDFELWLVNALLSVTFPFLIFYAAYFNFWPLRRG